MIISHIHIDSVYMCIEVNLLSFMNVHSTYVMCLNCTACTLYYIYIYILVSMQKLYTG